ncbi:hypothetical protein EDB92DRAFT_83340 [Lactarius akahatsu]|uniref:C2 domain-containing protein n=1 Tax=Lactarius akahatsu TaxID=416441 RepID=A0AAD4QFY4_9AGAM|nr:hypothetical protein EDB92DRAFT_83340 [Lactarius akahatsu]
MATAQYLEHQQTSSNSLGPSAPQISGRGSQITESQGTLSQLRVEVTVIRVHNVPHIKKQFGPKRRFFVTLTSHATVKTKSVQIDGQTVHWNQTLGAFSAQQSSPIILRLYEKRYLHPDVVIGTHQILIPAESQSDVPVEISNGDGEAGKSTQPVTLYLTIAVSSDATSPIFSTTPEVLTKEDNSSDEEPTKPTPVQAEMSPAEDALIALHRADDAKKLIDRRDIWNGAVSRIKWVMDTVSPIAELHPFAKMAYGLVSAIPGTLLKQYERDDNVLTLLEAMHDAFDFAQHEDTLKSIKPDSRQAEILNTMLRDVCSCSDFIRSYAKDEQFCTLSSSPLLADVNA